MKSIILITALLSLAGWTAQAQTTQVCGITVPTDSIWTAQAGTSWGEMLAGAMLDNDRADITTCKLNPGMDALVMTPKPGSNLSISVGLLPDDQPIVPWSSASPGNGPISPAPAPAPVLPVPVPVLPVPVPVLPVPVVPAAGIIRTANSDEVDGVPCDGGVINLPGGGAAEDWHPDHSRFFEQARVNAQTTCNALNLDTQFIHEPYLKNYFTGIHATGCVAYVDYRCAP